MQQCIDSGTLIACKTTSPDRWVRDLGHSLVATATQDLVIPTHSQVSSGHASSPPTHRNTLLCIVELTHSSTILPTLHCSMSTSSTQYSTCVHTIQYLCTYTQYSTCVRTHCCSVSHSRQCTIPAIGLYSTSTLISLHTCNLPSDKN